LRLYVDDYANIFLLLKYSKKQEKERKSILPKKNPKKRRASIHILVAKRFGFWVYISSTIFTLVFPMPMGYKFLFSIFLHINM
jgi:hypothetical protein